MIRKSSEKVTVKKPAPFQGTGEITVRSLLNGPEEMSQKGRVFGCMLTRYLTKRDKAGQMGITWEKP